MPLSLTPLEVIRACWMIFLAVWVVAAISTKRAVYRESRAQRLGYVLLLFVGCYLVFSGRRFGSPLNLRLLLPNAIIPWLAAVLCLAGLAFSIWARLTLGRNWSGTVTLKEGHELILRGPYRFVRHPIYTGLFAMILATAIAFGHLVAFVGVLLAFVSFWIKLGYEEKVMLSQFPDQYTAYQKRVKRIIPFFL
jgi:protein-S-isoprenylcysteine O-methyltransferase Ste14